MGFLLFLFRGNFVINHISFKNLCKKKLTFQILKYNFFIDLSFFPCEYFGYFETIAPRPNTLLEKLNAVDFFFSTSLWRSIPCII